MRRNKGFLLAAITLAMGGLLWALFLGLFTPHEAFSPTSSSALSDLRKDIARHGAYDSKLVQLGDSEFNASLPSSFQGKTVLDLSCGQGELCLNAARQGAKRVVGVDFSPDMVQLAKSRTTAGSPIDYYQADLNQGLNGLREIIGYERFDYVFYLGAVHAVDRQVLWETLNAYSKGECWVEPKFANGQELEQVREELSIQINGGAVDLVTSAPQRPLFVIRRTES